MTEKLKSDAKIIHSMLQQSYQTSGMLLATLEAPTSSPEIVSKLIDVMCSQVERGVVEMRNLCENDRPNELVELGKPSLPYRDIAGSVDVDRWGWLHIKLNTLLPNCRFATPAYLTDTIIRLLDDYEKQGCSLPRFDRAMLIIDEHCSVSSRTVFDQDNSATRSYTNTISQGTNLVGA